MSTHRSITRSLLNGSALSTLVFIAFSTTCAPASAQQAAAAGAQDTAAPAESSPEIVVTGTILRRTTKETPSPVTALSSDDLQKRGINTVSDAVLSISASNGGNLPENFSANGAFAAGASAVSLRGLTTDSTLVLFDGMRATSYPLADDGERSFVDLNTIPDAIVDRVEVLKDGGSATYGADAVAGVVNIILKKQITGFQGTVEGGISQRGDTGQQHLSATYGYGDLASNGFNFYINGEYQHNDALMARDRGFPYNTHDLTGLNLGNGVTGKDTNDQANGPNTGRNGSSQVAVVRPATQGTPGDILSGTELSGISQMLNPALCTGPYLTPHIGTSQGDYCEQNVVGQYLAIQPEQTRIGGTAHLTANVGDKAQAYLTGTYYQNKVEYPAPRGTARTKTTNPINSTGLILPALLANGSIDPYDPYANIIDPASGQREAASLYYRFGDIPTTNINFSHTYRVAGGINGSFGNDWHYTAEGTWMHTKLDQTFEGAVNLGALQNAINNGLYNFFDPSQNSQAVRDSISPNVYNTAKSTLWQVQGTISKGIVELPGGTLQVGVGGQIRYESVNDPNADANLATLDINPFTAKGHRYVEAGYFEINAPVIQKVEVDVSGRYDHYSIGFSHFSPKVGVKFTPIREVALRGTFQKGFRAPSIPETSGSVIGFVPYTLPASVVAAHGGDSYVQPYQLGINSGGNPGLKPEINTNFTGGAVVQPVRWLSITADYYHIKKKNLIIAGSGTSTIADGYVLGQGVPSGYTVTLNPVDPAHPDLPATVNAVNGLYFNAQSLVTDGIDLSASATFQLAPGIKFTSSGEATEIFRYNINQGAGLPVLRYAGTVGSYNVTSGSGTPKWRANWQNTLDMGKWSLTGTIYYTGGYWGYADDYKGHGCANVPATGTDDTTAVQCRVKHFTEVDMTASYHVSEQFTFYVNILNLFDAKAPFDPNTYGGVNYNPSWSSAGVIGRYFKAGANFKF